MKSAICGLFFLGLAQTIFNDQEVHENEFETFYLLDNIIKDVSDQERLDQILVENQELINKLNDRIVSEEKTFKMGISESDIECVANDDEETERRREWCRIWGRVFDEPYKKNHL
ncbi:uncharacterized protein LOC117788049 [Drosophila innubila]|uniref:uncharacterized protein LOC117788049 n=1 Tax=Drosophila innubila TaxID=198719 RepID=UPI00148DE505|nr:uncharacterized protein LOC117788049 [Drosophila innubila]